MSRNCPVYFVTVLYVPEQCDGLSCYFEHKLWASCTVGDGSVLMALHLSRRPPDGVYLKGKGSPFYQDLIKKEHNYVSSREEVLTAHTISSPEGKTFMLTLLCATCRDHCCPTGCNFVISTAEELWCRNWMRCFGVSVGSRDFYSTSISIVYAIAQI